MANRFYTLLPWLILAVGLSLTTWRWRDVVDENERLRRLEFDRLYGRITSAIANRVDSYADTNSAAAALFRHSVVVTRREWRQFVDSLRLQHRHPGVTGAGYIEVVERADLAVFESRVRFDGYPDFEVRSNGVYDRVYPVKLIEPIENNRAALGLDMQIEPGARIAMARARDRGHTQMSAQVLLVQEAEQPSGFLLFLPLYGSQPSPESVEKRRATITGWIFASFVSQDFIAGLLEELFPNAHEELSLAVYSGAQVDESIRIYRDPHPLAEPAPAEEKLVRTEVFDMLGQPWTIVGRPGASFHQFVPDHDATLELLSGLGISFAVFGVFLSMTQTRRRALRLARARAEQLVERSEALESSNRELEAAVRTAEQAADALLEQHATLARTDRMAAVGEMAGGLAHEIRNPLAGIRMSLQNLHAETRDAEVRERIELPIAELDRLARLLNRYLSPLRHEPEALSEVDLKDLVDELCSLLRYRLPDNVTLAADVADDIVWRLPKDRLRQSLLNLVLNSLQAIGDAPGSVAIGAARSEAGLEIFVEDDGPGFPDSVLEGPVRRFQSHSDEGTGLGLAMVQRVAEDLGGRLMLERRAEGGARVRLEIPEPQA